MMDANKRYSLLVCKNVAKDEMAVEAAAWAAMGEMNGDNTLYAKSGEVLGRVVESYVSSGPAFKNVQVGDWLLGVVWEPSAWADIQRGKAPAVKMR
jgi:hypothetical protein